MQMARKVAQRPLEQGQGQGPMARKTIVAASTSGARIVDVPRQHTRESQHHPQPDDRRKAAKKHRAVQSQSAPGWRVSRKSTTMTDNHSNRRTSRADNRQVEGCYPPGPLYQQPFHASWKIQEPVARGTFIPIVPIRAIRKQTFDDARFVIRAGKRRISGYKAAKKRKAFQPKRVRPQAMQASNVIDLSSDSEQDGGAKYDDSLGARPISPALELSEAMEALAISIPIEQSTRRVYLRRNVRRGFLGMCHTFNINCEPSPPPGNVVYVISVFDPESDDDEEVVVEQSYVSEQSSWRCPLCDTLGDRCPVNREMLEFHLWKDHSDVKHEWKTRKIRDVEGLVWTVALKIPEILEEDEEEWRSSSPPILDVADNDSGHECEDPVTHMETEETTPIPDLSFKFESQMKLTAPVASAALPRPIIHTPKRELEDDLVPVSSDQASDPDEYKRPAARYPYLPARASDGTVVQYSCRPGGPKLYDLLDTLSTDDIGLLIWDIHDRENVLFQLDDVADEDKVMHALWNRWIHCNRVQFLTDYPAAVNDFVESNHGIIHEAAGWAALRGWLLVMLANKFLTLKEVALILQGYGERAGLNGDQN